MNPLKIFRNISSMTENFKNKILHVFYINTCLMFISMQNNKILFNYPQLQQSYAILSMTILWIFTFH